MASMDDRSVAEIIADAGTEVNWEQMDFSFSYEGVELYFNANVVNERPPQPPPPGGTAEDPPNPNPRRTDCIGRPQLVRHGEGLEDQYKKHYYMRAVEHMEHRIARIVSVENGEPVLTPEDYSDEQLAFELDENLGKMDHESPWFKEILAQYKKERINEIKGWMEEEEIVRKQAIQKGTLTEEDIKRLAGNRDKYRMINMRCPKTDFTKEDKEMVSRYDPKGFFPVEGEYLFREKMQLLDVHPEIADRIYFDIPRRPEAYTSENKDHPEVWCPKGIKERVGINQEHLQLMKKILESFKYGITSKKFWDVFVMKVDSSESLLSILGYREPKEFVVEASDIFYSPKKNNPFQLIYSASQKDNMPTPEDILALIWHDIRTILGDKISRPDGRLPLDSISDELKRIFDVDVDPSDFGFPNWKELCLYFIKYYGNPNRIGVFDIIFGDKSYMSPELAVLTKSNLEDFERKTNIAKASYAKCYKKILAAQSGIANRINKWMTMEADHKFMEHPEDIVRIPYLPGTRLLCFVDNFAPIYPLFLWVIPTALRSMWRELNFKVQYFYEGREGRNAKIDGHPEIELVIGLPVIVYFQFHDQYNSQINSYHRAKIVNRKSAEKLLLVELYDRHRIVEVGYDSVCLMSPEIFYFAPAMCTGIRIHVDSEKYPRAIEATFAKRFFKFTEEEMEDLASPIFMGGDIYVDLIEEFPMRNPYQHFWSAVAEHESRAMRVRYMDEGPQDLFDVGYLITLNADLNKRFEESYYNYLYHCEENNIEPLEQKLTNPTVYPAVIDMTEITQEDILRSIDHLYAVEEEEVEEEKEEVVVPLEEEKVEEEPDKVD